MYVQILVYVQIRKNIIYDGKKIENMNSEVTKGTTILSNINVSILKNYDAETCGIMGYAAV